MSAIKNLSWSASASTLGAIFDVAKLVVLARYIAPQHFAEFAIALVVVGFCQLFSEGGVGNALVSKKQVPAVQAGHILNFNILIAISITCLVILLNPWIADFYQAPDLLLLIPMIVIVIPCSAISRIYQAMLQRELQMQLIAKATVIGKLVGLLVAWWAAEMSLGVFAFAWSIIASTFITLALMAKPASKNITYQLSIKWKYIKPILSFSIYQLGELLLNFFAKNFDVLLITKLLGVEVSGLYVICKNLLTRVGDIVVATFVRYFHPLMAKIQHDQAQLKTYYLGFFRSVSLCVLLAYVLVAMNHQLIVSLLLGESYLAANALFPLMAFWLGLRYCTAPVATLWLVRQKPQVGLYWNILVAILVPCAVYLSHAEGLYNILIGLTLVQVFFLALSVVITYWLTWSSSDLTKALLIWLLGGIILTTPLYWLSTTQILSLSYALLSSIIMLVFIMLLAWKRRSIFFND